MTSRLVSTLLVGSTLLLAACSAGQQADTLNAEAETGAVAAASICRGGPPASTPLSQLDDPNSDDEDGVLGALYNTSSKPVWLSVTWGGQSSTACMLQPNGRAAYAFSTPGSVSTVLKIADSEAEDATYTTISLRDPVIGYPEITFNGALNQSKGCRMGSYRNFKLQSGFTKSGPAEGETFKVVGTDSIKDGGEYTVTRLKDDAAIAEQWTGGGENTSDWARIDITVTLAPSCSS